MAMGLVWLGSVVRKRVVDKISKDMEQAGAQAVSYAKELVPIRTGQLEASISYHWSRETMTLSLVADKEYATYVEFGTRMMPARPYLRPALREVGSFFGLANIEVSLPNTPAKYQQGYQSQANRQHRPKVIIGHRPRRKR